MSYDLRIWSRERVEPDEYEFNIGDYIVSIDECVEVENEDIAPEILQSFIGVKYLTSLYLQPYTNEKAIISKFIKYAEKLAKKYSGIVENPRSVENKPLARNLLPKNSQEDKK